MKQRTRRIYEGVLVEVHRAGATAGPPVVGGKHWRLPVTVAGRTHKLTMPQSTSDVRSEQNAIHDARRLLREWAR